MVDDAWGRTAFLVGGWLLGLLSPVIVETIRRARDLRPMQDSLADELHEFRFSAACVSSILRTHLGTTDRAFHQWFKSISDGYTGVLATEKFRKASGGYLELNDDQLAALSELQAGDEQSALNMKKMAVFGLEARLSSLWMFPRRAQSELLRLLADISIFNDEVDNANHYLKLTFQKLEEGNHQLAQRNLRGAYDSLAKISGRLADQAGKCEAGLRSARWIA